MKKSFKYSGNYKLVLLKEVVFYVNERINVSAINLKDYISTDNILPNRQGITVYNSIPQISSVIKYSQNDVLLSNIRPYLKKIWLADRNGGCSTDVLVFRINDENILLPEYLFLVLNSE